MGHEFLRQLSTVRQSGQQDSDGDRLGDVCDPDDDNDGILDAEEPRTVKLLVLSDLSGLLPTGDRKTDDRLRKPSSTFRGVSNRDTGRRTRRSARRVGVVFERERKAVRELMRIVEKDGPLASSAQAAIDALVAADFTLAEEQIRLPSRAVAGRRTSSAPTRRWQRLRLS